MAAAFQPRFRMGFSGTRKGLTAQQAAAVRAELREQLQQQPNKEPQAHHGDAVGSDAEFHALCLEHQIRVVLHPPLTDRERAFCAGAADERPRADFSEQSDAIVNATEILIACPDGMKEKARGSGTWMTVRRARKAGRTIVFCWPDGSRKTEDGT